MSVKRTVLLIAVLASLHLGAVTKAHIDSLLQVVKVAKTTLDRLNALYALSFEYGMLEPRIGINYGFECLSMARKEKNLLYQLNAFNGIANCYETLSKFDSAKYYHRCSYEVALKMNVPMKIALTSFNMGLCSKQLGDYNTALSEYLEAYRIMEKAKDYNPRIHFYMGEIFMRSGDYAQAEHHTRLGIKKCTELGHTHVLLIMNVNLARCMVQKGELDSALAILKTAITKFKSQTDDVGIALSLGTLGEIYSGKGKYKLASDYFLQELEVQRKTNNRNGMLLASVNLAYSLANLKAPEKELIKEYLNFSIQQSALVTMNSDVLLEWFRKMSESYERIGDFKGAYQSHKRYLQVYDSLMNRDKIRQLLELQTKYETEKKESQIKYLEQSHRMKTLELNASEQAVSRRNYLIFSVILLFCMMGVLVFSFWQKQKQKALFERNLAIKATEEKERLRMAKDIHDDLGSGLSKINFLSEVVAAKSAGNDETKNTSKAISDTAQKLIVNMRDLIWALDPGNVTLDGLISRLREYSSDYMEEFSADFKVLTSDNIPLKPIGKEAYRSILMTVKEALNNVVKHSKATSVTLSILIEGNILSIKLSDNGRGIQSVRDGGNGINNMRARIESIGGSFVMSHSDGTTVDIVIPLEKIIGEEILLSC